MQVVLKRVLDSHALPVFTTVGDVFVIQSSSSVQLFVISQTVVCQASLSLNISWCLPKFLFITSVMPSHHLILWVRFSFCLQCFPASGTFQMSHLFTSDDQNTGASASASVLPVNIQGLSPLRMTGLIPLQSKGLSGVFSSHSLKASILWPSSFFMVQLSQLYVTTGKLGIGLIKCDLFVSELVLHSQKISECPCFYLTHSKRSRNKEPCGVSREENYRYHKWLLIQSLFLLNTCCVVTVFIAGIET